jgi:hypothetical protein
MKPICLLLFCIVLVNRIHSQSRTDESTVLKLSNEIFKWEVGNKIDSLESLLHEKFVVVNSAGQTQTKQQYVSRLKSGNFIHDHINVEENSAVVSNNTAVVTGKGKFDVTVSGNKVALYLSYIEVFTRKNAKGSWLVLAMKASSLEK